MNNEKIENDFENKYNCEELVKMSELIMEKLKPEFKLIIEENGDIRYEYINKLREIK